MEVARRPLPPMGSRFRQIEAAKDAARKGFNDHPSGDLSLGAGTANASMDARATLNARIASRLLYWRQESAVGMLSHLRAKNQAIAANATKEALVLACLALEFSVDDLDTYMVERKAGEVRK